MNLNVDAALNADGHLVCNLTYEGQAAQVTFTGTEVLMAIPEPVPPPPAAMRGGGISVTPHSERYIATNEETP